MTGSPRVHAEIIKAWADGTAIQIREDDGSWHDVSWDFPIFDEKFEYRLKPANEYPKTRLSDRDLSRLLVQNRGVCESTTMARIIANAALRQACDTGQLVVREEFDRAVGDRKARDMAVAKEVVKSLCWVHHSAVESHFDEDYLLPVIARADKTRKTP